MNKEFYKTLSSQVGASITSLTEAQESILKDVFADELKHHPDKTMADLIDNTEWNEWPDKGSTVSIYGTQKLQLMPPEWKTECKDDTYLFTLTQKYKRVNI